jgi:Na+-driven multidrug efflux pump
MQEIINLIYVGQLNSTTIIAGVGLSNAFINMIGVSTIIGMNGALDTLCSQAANNVDRCFSYL